MDRHATEKLKLRCAGLEVYLLAEKCLWIPDLGSVCLADTHFGKAATFRHLGLPVPAGTTATMLQRINYVLEQTQASELVVLGDWIHSSCTLGSDYFDDLITWRHKWHSLTIRLIVGNHDRRNLSLLEPLEMQVQPEGTRLGPFALYHYPEEHRLTDEPVGKNPFRLCGHKHPCVAIPVAPRQLQKFPCFVISPNQIILPAFGEFTGMSQVYPSDEQRLVACLGSSLVNVPSEPSSLSMRR